MNRTARSSHSWVLPPRLAEKVGLALLVLLTGAGVAGCASGGQDADGAGRPGLGGRPGGGGEVDPLPPRGVASGADPENPFAKAAREMEQFNRSRAGASAEPAAPAAPAAPAPPAALMPPGPPPPPGPTSVPTAAAAAVEPSGSQQPPADPAAVGPPAPGPAAGSGVTVARAEPRQVPAATEPAGARRARLIGELAALLQQEADGSGTPMREALALVLLAGLDPAVTPGQAQRRLTPEQAEVLDSMRQLVQRVVGPEGTAAAGDPAALAGALADAAAATAAQRVLNLPVALLAWRVEAFGRYTPLASTAFVAGRGHAVVLYTEVENFAARQGEGENRAASDPAGPWTVWLSQSVELFAADGTRAWSRPEQSVRDQSRTRRRDFFLTQRLELPSNLSIGSYTLRVTVRDKLAGAQSEAVIPITVVADAQMAALKQDWERRQSTPAPAASPQR